MLTNHLSATFFLKPLFDTPHLFPMAAIHGAVLTLWFVLMLSQALLAARQRLDLHARLGIAGCVVAIVAVATFVPTAVGVVPRRIDAGMLDPAVLMHAERYTAMTRDLLTFAAFPVFVALAVGFRRRPEAHKRLMLLATLSLLPAALTRLFLLPGLPVIGNPMGPLVVGALLLIAPVVHDVLTRGRVHPALAWGASLYYAYGAAVSALTPPVGIG